MPTGLPPSSEEIGSFLKSLREQRERLMVLATNGSPETAEELAETIDEIGEQLLVADEELRVQNEHLTLSMHRLDLLVAAHEQLFANAPTAYVQTDAEGVVLRYNTAARRVLALPAHEGRTRPLANMLLPEDRTAFRRMITRLRTTTSGVPFAPPLEPLEVTAIGPDGARTPIALTGRRSTDGDPRRVVLHWELQERARPSAPAEARAGSDKAQPPSERLRAMAEAASDLARQQNPAMTLAHVAQQARTAVPACDEVGVTLVRAKGRIETPAATGELAAACDQLQYDLGEGPCLGALDDSTPVRVRDMANDSRWPRFGPRASMLGVGSMLALPLHAPRGTVGALNLYARATCAFDQDDELIGLAFATHAGIALAHAGMEANLRIALETREEIGRAVGILMERHRVTAAAAFDMLVVASQHTHRKLRDIAAWMNETGEDPTALVRGKAH